MKELAKAYCAEKGLDKPEAVIDALARQFAGSFTRAQEKRGAASALAWAGRYDGNKVKELVKRIEESPAILDGATASRLHDELGLPLDFIMDVARDQGINFDQAGFDAAQKKELEKRIEESPAILGGATAFRLYDTLGLPLDFMSDAARDQGMSFDQAGFDAAMEEQSTIARASWKGGSQKSASPVFAAPAAHHLRGLHAGAVLRTAKFSPSSKTA